MFQHSWVLFAADFDLLGRVFVCSSWWSGEVGSGGYFYILVHAGLHADSCDGGFEWQPAFMVDCLSMPLDICFIFHACSVLVTI